MSIADHNQALRNALKDILRSCRKDFPNDPEGERNFKAAYAEQFAILAMQEPASEPTIEADPDMVICPNCTHQFGAIPVNVQAALRASEPALAALRPAQDAEGWAMVPREPTEAMEAAAYEKTMECHDIEKSHWDARVPGDIFRIAYRAMIAASPPRTLEGK